MLRRALDFIHENAQYDITIRDIAAAADVTPRAIQYAFREHMVLTVSQDDDRGVLIRH
ncbi:helix-turn-helix transcriptional regulator [Mycolicibacterium vanbaalenii]|nr:helix-turn-helix transcriptional regulator [Mycolicibacterium vanbaalenii]